MCISGSSQSLCVWLGGVKNILFEMIMRITWVVTHSCPRFTSRLACLLVVVSLLSLYVALLGRLADLALPWRSSPSCALDRFFGTYSACRCFQHARPRLTLRRLMSVLRLQLEAARSCVDPRTWANISAGVSFVGRARFVGRNAS